MVQDTFEPDVQLEAQEVADLAGIVRHPGFTVVQKICKSTVDRFVQDLVNADSDEDVLSRHKAAKFSAQFYTRLINKINQEISDYSNQIRDTDPPVDSGAGLDFGGLGNYLEVNEEEESF